MAKLTYTVFKDTHCLQNNNEAYSHSASSFHAIPWSLISEAKLTLLLNDSSNLPVGSKCMVVWDGPLVGTPDGWRGGAGCMGCNGRDIGWEELMADKGVRFSFFGSVN
jgi:hypothetical protein